MSKAKCEKCGGKTSPKYKYCLPCWESYAGPLPYPHTDSYEDPWEDVLRAEAWGD